MPFDVAWAMSKKIFNCYSWYSDYFVCILVIALILNWTNIIYIIRKAFVHDYLPARTTYLMICLWQHAWKWFITGNDIKDMEIFIFTIINHSSADGSCISMCACIYTPAYVCCAHVYGSTCWYYIPFYNNDVIGTICHLFVVELLNVHHYNIIMVIFRYLNDKYNMSNAFMIHDIVINLKREIWWTSSVGYVNKLLQN